MNAMKKELIEEIIAFAQNRSRTVIRICGHGASGKSTFAKELQAAFSLGSAQIIETDTYIVSNPTPQRLLLEDEIDGQVEVGSLTACHPSRHDVDSLRRDLTMLARGMDVLTIDIPWSPEYILRADCPVTIVEGMTPTFLEKDLFDLSLFFYTDAETELARRLERDTTVRGRNRLFVQATHQHRRRQYDLYMAPYQKKFDVIVNQSGNQFVIEKTGWANPVFL